MLNYSNYHGMQIKAIRYLYLPINVAKIPKADIPSVDKDTKQLEFCPTAEVRWGWEAGKVSGSSCLCQMAHILGGGTCSGERRAGCGEEDIKESWNPRGTHLQLLMKT